MSWLSRWISGGEWVTHPCKVPQISPHYEDETWKCRCGRKWILKRSTSGGLYHGRYWKEVEE